ncbi:MAG: hypothetical protein PHU23_19600, partial [Dehalococcoidales bacterium]|nr:hypothetical protein [Dehalococcoidales bacterium]
ENKMPISGIEVVKGPVTTNVQPGMPISLTYGDTLRVRVTFDYIGPLKFTLVGSIGKKNGEFKEMLTGTTPVDLPSYNGLTAGTATVNIKITSKIKPGEEYSLQCKAKEIPGEPTAEIVGQITITGTPGQEWLPGVIGGAGLLVVGTLIVISGRGKEKKPLPLEVGRIPLPDHSIQY